MSLNRCAWNIPCSWALESGRPQNKIQPFLSLSVGQSAVFLLYQQLCSGPFNQQPERDGIWTFLLQLSCVTRLWSSMDIQPLFGFLVLASLHKSFLNGWMPVPGMRCKPLHRSSGPLLPRLCVVKLLLKWIQMAHMAWSPLQSGFPTSHNHSNSLTSSMRLPCEASVILRKCHLGGFSWQNSTVGYSPSTECHVRFVEQGLIFGVP